MGRDREAMDDLLHDLRNVLGLVHVAAAAAQESHAAGEDVGGQLVELVSLSKLATDVLRGMGSSGAQSRPFDLRAAVVVARTEERAIAIGELFVPVSVDAAAGELVQLVLVVVRELMEGDEGRIDVTQGEDGSLRFIPGVPSRDATRAVASASKERAKRVGLEITAEDRAVVLRAPKRAAR